MPLSHLGHNGCILHDYAYTDTEKKINWRNGNIFLKPSAYLPNPSSFKDSENSNKKSECWLWRGISLVPKTFTLSLRRTFLQWKQLCNISTHIYRYIGQWNSTFILHITYHLSGIALWAGRTLCPSRALWNKHIETNQNRHVEIPCFYSFDELNWISAKSNSNSASFIVLKWNVTNLRTWWTKGSILPSIACHTLKKRSKKESI